MSGWLCAVALVVSVIAVTLAAVVVRAWLLPDDYFDPQRDIGI